MARLVSIVALVGLASLLVWLSPIGAQMDDQSNNQGTYSDRIFIMTGAQITMNLPDEAVMRQFAEQTENMQMDNFWIVLYENQNGEMGEEVGYIGLNKGDDKKMVTKLELKGNSENFIAQLHYDRGTVGEYGNGDEVVMVEGDPLQAEVQVDSALKVGNQSK